MPGRSVVGGMRYIDVVRALLVSFVCAAVCWPNADARADSGAATPDLEADRRAIVVRLTAERAITLASARGLADAAQDELYRQLEVKDRALRAALSRAAGNAAELARVRQARDEIARQRQALVTALAQRDQMLAAEVRAYREEVTKIAASPDPEKQKALQRFADGEQAEALDDLDLLADAKRAAHDKAVAIADAAERRPTAWLAVQAYDAGKVTLDKVVARFEKLTQLDPTMTDDWIELARLYREQGRLADARQAAEGAGRSLAGSDERTRSTVLTELGDVAVQAGDLAGAKARFEEALVIDRKLAQTKPTTAEAQRDISIDLDRLGDVAVQAGDLAGAKARFEEALVIDRKLAQANPTSAEAQRDISVVLNKLGDVAVQAGDLACAKARFEEGLVLRRKLAQANPTSAQAQRAVSIDLNKLGDVAVEAGDLAGAKARFEEGLVIRRKLAQANPASAEAQRDISVGLDKLGDVAVQAGDLASAKVRFEESLVIRRKIAQANPTSAEAQRDVSIDLNKLGDVAVEAGDLAGATVRFEEGLVIARKLAQANPTSAEAQRDVIVSLFKLGRAIRDRALLREALQIARDLERTGRLAPRDHAILDTITDALDSLP